jgi:uncharacterized protein YggE
MTVIVAGEATSVVAADSADMTLLVVTAGPSAAHAMREAASGMTRIVQSLTALGVRQNDLHPRVLSLQPLYPPAWSPPAGGPAASVAPTAIQYGDAPGDLRPLAGFRVIGSVRVVVRDPNQVGDALDAGIAAGASAVADVSFRLQDEERARRALLVQAIADARAKAEAIAATLGRHAGDPLEFVEEPVAPPLPGECLGVVDSHHLDSAASTAIPILVGRLTFSARLRARFELTDH